MRVHVPNAQQCFAFLYYSWNRVCRLSRLCCIKHPAMFCHFMLQLKPSLQWTAHWEHFEHYTVVTMHSLAWADTVLQGQSWLNGFCKWAECRTKCVQPAAEANLFSSNSIRAPSARTPKFKLELFGAAKTFPSVKVLGAVS